MTKSFELWTNSFLLFKSWNAGNARAGKVGNALLASSGRCLWEQPPKLAPFASKNQQQRLLKCAHLVCLLRCFLIKLAETLVSPKFFQFCQNAKPQFHIYFYTYFYTNHKENRAFSQQFFFQFKTREFLFEILVKKPAVMKFFLRRTLVTSSIDIYHWLLVGLLI